MIVAGEGKCELHALPSALFVLTVIPQVDWSTR